MSLAWLLGVFARYRIVFLAASLLPPFVVATYHLVKPRSYTASASFVPQARSNQAGNLAGLASQFGLALPTSDPSETPGFYVDLLTSRTILAPVVDTAYAVSPDSTLALTDEWGNDEPTAARRRAAAMDELREHMHTAVGKTGIVTVAVRTESPELSLGVLQRLLGAVARYNLETRQSKAAAERRFAEQRLDVVEGELRVAENQLQRFLQSNRTYSSAPQLVFEHDRLQRQVREQAALRTTLRDAVERARLEEVRDTPVISFVEQPERPARPDPRGLLMKTILALVAGVVGAAGLVVALSYLRGLRRPARSAAPVPVPVRGAPRSAPAEAESWPEHTTAGD